MDNDDSLTTIHQKKQQKERFFELGRSEMWINPHFIHHNVPYEKMFIFF